MRGMLEADAGGSFRGSFRSQVKAAVQRGTAEFRSRMEQEQSRQHLAGRGVPGWSGGGGRGALGEPGGARGGPGGIGDTESAARALPEEHERVV